jgi:hypothetical protein
MRRIGFAFNFNIQRCEVEVGAEAPIVSEGYWPLLGALDERGIAADLFLSGYSTQSILAIDPSLADFIRSRLGSRFRTGSYTYTHPIPQMLSPPEMRRQIDRGIRIDEETWGMRPKGFFPPEFAFTRGLARQLLDCGIEYTIVLSNFRAEDAPESDESSLYRPYVAELGEGESIVAVPIALDLPGPGRRFFKRMLQGSLSPRDAADGLFSFLDRHDDVFVVLERDAETLYVDDILAGTGGARNRLEVFLDLVISGLGEHGVEICHIEDRLAQSPPSGSVELRDRLGNTKLETFTEGTSRGLWEKTLAVRARLLACDALPLSERERCILERAWEHMLLSHNSDGRIGYWNSDWKPGEHVVVRSRRDFVEFHLDGAARELDRLEGI